MGAMRFTREKHRAHGALVSGFCFSFAGESGVRHADEAQCLQHV